MKTVLTREQSDKLLLLGVPANKAYTWYLGNNPEVRNDHVFCLTDLLKILPERINRDEVCNTYREALITMSYMDEGWVCEYRGLIYKGGLKYKTELIDSLYELLLWVIEAGYLKF